MPALTSYSPYETLVLFQNVARHGTDALAFQEISTTLKENHLIKAGKSYDSSRFSPAALQTLYERLIRAQSDEITKQVNGDSDGSESNPRKRKLSVSPSPKDEKKQDEDAVLQSFVDKLYARFREESIKEIHRDEQEYDKLQTEIRQLEKQANVDETNPAGISLKQDDGNISATVGSLTNGDKNDQGATEPLGGADSGRQNEREAVAVPQLATASSRASSQSRTVQAQESVQHSPGSTATVYAQRSPAGTPQAGPTQPHQPPGQPAHYPSPGPQDGIQQQRSPQPAAYAPMPNQYGYVQGTHPPQMLPSGHVFAQMPPPEYATGRRTPGQGQASPAPHQGQPSYQQYAQYAQGSPHWQSPVPSQPYMHPHYGAAPFYPQSSRAPQSFQASGQPHYQQIPTNAQVSYPTQQHWQGHPTPQYPGYPTSTNVTPVQRSASRQALLHSANSTPWKRKTPTPGRRQPSPSRVEREVSPLSDHETSPGNMKLEQPDRRDELNARGDRSKRRRSASPPLRAMSRSQSVMSHTSETTSEKRGPGRRAQRVKAEPPSTPAAITSDIEQQRSSGRRGRPRNNTATNRPDMTKMSTTQKRKRESIVSRSPSPSSRSPAGQQPVSTSRRIPSPLDPSLVVASKNFAKTANLLLNEITSHKLAGIFAKPLSERDAPGYKDIVQQPQDLKSIKAAISKGSRIAAATMEEIEGHEDENGDQETTPTAKIPIVSHREGSIGNGFYFVKKTEEMIPPRGIVNSSQLEMELVRMFANAVMFNPLPSAERGFGRALRLRRMGGDILADEDADTDDSTNGEEGGASSGDEGGIISDAREMFDDVMQLVARWRDLEGERLIGPNIATPGDQTSTAARHASVSASSAVHEEDDEASGAATPGPAATSTTGRKRRKLGDH